MSEREAAVYARAIRLWGADAQKRLMDAKVLVIGLTGLTAEVSRSFGKRFRLLLEPCVAQRQRECLCAALHRYLRSCAKTSPSPASAS